MAWISVEQTLIGKKLRVLAKHIGCSQNEAVGILINLWLWGMDNASEDGLLDGAEKEDIAMVITPCMDKTLDAEIIVENLIENGWLDCIEGDLFIHDWGEYRAYYNRYVKEKKNNAQRQRDFRARKRAEKKATVAIRIPDVKEEKKNEAPKGNNKKAPYTVQFEELWKIYPRKKDKGNAYKKYKARLNDGWSEEDLFSAVKGYAAECGKNRTEEKYIKHASTFFSETTPFVDYLKKKEKIEEPQRNTGSNPFR